MEIRLVETVRAEKISYTIIQIKGGRTTIVDCYKELADAERAYEKLVTRLKQSIVPVKSTVLKSTII